MSETHIYPTSIVKVNGTSLTVEEDFLAIEEPMEIRITHGTLEQRIRKSISITMRTPGNDFELALGFLFTEGIIHSQSDVIKIEHCKNDDKDTFNNVVRIEFHPKVDFDSKKMERNFYTTAACGLCGKTSIEAVFSNNIPELVPHDFQLNIPTLHSLNEKLLRHQTTFGKTGGLHAAALFDNKGNLKIIREDIGRHNALDKLIGAALLESKMPLSKHILLLSGRAGFELIQKALVAGIAIVAAVGAPSSLAVELAQESNMTLIGFLRNNRFNVYSGKERILL